MRDHYWDIIKGIGIICVVIGHCCPVGEVIAFVYLFHLPIFFFVSGFLYKPEKWQREGLDKYIGSRFSSSWVRFMLYGVFTVAIHNTFVEQGLMAAAPYNHTEMLQMVISHGLYLTSDNNDGALWFVAPWLLSCIALGSVVAVSQKYLPEKLCKPAAMGLMLGISVAGVFLSSRSAGIMYNAHISMAMMYPVMLGFALRAYCPEFRTKLRIVPAIICLLVSAALLYRMEQQGIRMNLACTEIDAKFSWIHVPVGILFCLALAQLISFLPGIKTITGFLGRHSFDIMALHFTVFKVIDWVYIKLNPALAESSSGFPVSFAADLFPFYVLLGLAIPALAGAGLDRAKAAVAGLKRH